MKKLIDYKWPLYIAAVYFRNINGNISENNMADFLSSVFLYYHKL